MNGQLNSIPDFQLEYPIISTIQYLGSKSRLVNNICPIILDNESIDTVVDLFAGTGTISYALKDKLAVYANDLQVYSHVILEGILNGCMLSIEDEKCFFNNAVSIKEQLNYFLRNALEEEKEFLNKFSDQKVNQYKKFCEETPNIYKPNYDLTCFKDAIELFKIKPGKLPNKNIPPCLFTTYFANAYFGLNQCVEIDALRAAIDLQNEESQRYVLLTALMSAMSVVASSTTHFAQFLKVKDASTARYLISKRKLSISHLMLEKLLHYRAIGLLSSKEKGHSKCGNIDYLDFLDQIPLGENTLVYADPPYFKEHYSRYYHVLETLCLYDYPELTFNKRLNDITTGRYRNDRQSSPFGKKSSALGAFRQLFSTCAQQSVPLVVSYSDNSIVDVNDIKACGDEWYNTEVFEFLLNHSSQGRAVINHQVTEIVILANPKRKIHAIGHKQLSDLLCKLSIEEPLYDNPASAMHNYMARKPYNIISKLIDGLLEHPSVVLDPFAGSGTTLIEARKLKHKIIGIDLNYQASLLMRVSLSDWEIDKIKKLLFSFIEKLEKSLTQLYYIDEDGGSSVYLERCHFNLNSNEKLMPCKYWGYPVKKDGSLGSRKEYKITKEFIKQYEKLENESTKLFPSIRLMTNKRIAISPDIEIGDYFCGRNKLAVLLILDGLKFYKETKEYELLECVISSALNLIRLSDKKASSQIPYWRPKKNITSRNALIILKRKIDLFIEGLKYLSTYCPGHLA